MKELYRANYIASREDCTATSLEYEDIDCGFVCAEETYDDLPDAIKNAMTGQYVSTTVTTADWETLRDFICTGDGYRVFVADHLGTSSFLPSVYLHRSTYSETSCMLIFFALQSSKPVARARM
jgi:hypothetical protein